MAIDTPQKRFSMMGFGNPLLKLVFPTGSITAGDRSTFIDLYSGIALPPPVIVEAKNLLADILIASLFNTETVLDSLLDTDTTLR